MGYGQQQQLREIGSAHTDLVLHHHFPATLRPRVQCQGSTLTQCVLASWLSPFLKKSLQFDKLLSVSLAHFPNILLHFHVASPDRREGPYQHRCSQHVEQLPARMYTPHCDEDWNPSVCLCMLMLLVVTDRCASSMSCRFFLY